MTQPPGTSFVHDNIDAVTWRQEVVNAQPPLDAEWHSRIVPGYCLLSRQTGVGVRIKMRVPGRYRAELIRIARHLDTLDPSTLPEKDHPHDQDPEADAGGTPF